VGHISEHHGIQQLLAPASIAVVGASEKRGHSKYALTNLTGRGYQGEVYVVNPNRAQVHGHRAFPTLADLPKVPDLALVLVGRDVVLDVLDDCRQAGVHAAIINADGYSESPDPLGHRLQAALVEAARNADIALCGPNCLGLINRSIDAAPFCAPIETPILNGGVCVLSESGGHSCAFLESAYDRHLGISHVISTGNEAVITTADYLDYLVTDPAVGTFCLFLESIRDPERFLAAATRAASMGKPIVAIKVGRSAEARAAALAHTGSMVGDDVTVDALFERGGVIRARSIDDALDKCLLMARLPQDLWPKGRRLAVFTMGGGSAGLMADLAAEANFTIPQLDESLRRELEPLAPTTVTVKNPLDLPGAYFGSHPELPGAFVRGTASRDYDAVLILALLTSSLEFWARLEPIQRECGKPIIIVGPASNPLSDSVREFIDASSLPVVAGLDRCVAALDAAVRSREKRPRVRSYHQRHSGLAQALSAASLPSTINPPGTRSVLDYSTSMRLLDSYGIPVVASMIVGTAEEARIFARRNGYPIALKIASGLAHKSDVGGVALNIRSSREVDSAFAKLADVANAQSEDGLQLVAQAMVTGGTEVIIGASRHEDAYPPSVLVGLGGIWVEVMRDVAIRLAPIDHVDAVEMITQLRGYPLLSGGRGSTPVHLDALADAIVRVSHLVVDIPELIELDINPAIVTSEGLKVVDALAVVGPVSPSHVS
jgi:acyl-CoA synthetase (NDP forming)